MWKKKKKNKVAHAFGIAVIVLTLDCTLYMLSMSATLSWRAAWENIMLALIYVSLAWNAYHCSKYIQLYIYICRLYTPINIYIHMYICMYIYIWYYMILLSIVVWVFLCWPNWKILPTTELGTWFISWASAGERRPGRCCPWSTGRMENTHVPHLKVGINMNKPSKLEDIWRYCKMIVRTQNWLNDIKCCPWQLAVVYSHRRLPRCQW